ncbi:Alpha/beta hydrolase fold-1 [Coniochaeta sp. 2T2.1]|nr:Alpha/beta hydrolase fold-1 [Coniochaeta sp. 2T2.1]
MSPPADAPLTIIIPGSFHQPAHYLPFVSLLRSYGYEVLCPQLPTSSPAPSHLDDKRRIFDLLLPYLDAGRQAVVVAHSYGDMPATEAVEGQSVEERRVRGLKGGVKAVVYLAGVPVFKKGETKLLVNDNTAEVFYHNIEPEARNEAASLLCSASIMPFKVPVVFTMQKVTVPKTYIVCTHDRAIPPEVQRFVAREGGGCKVVEVDSGHSPFLNEAAREVIVRVVVEAHASSGKGPA